MNTQYKSVYNLEPSVPFQFLEDIDNIDTVVKDDNIRKLLDFLCYYIVPDTNPRVKLIIFLYISGYNVGELLSCENTIRSISKKLSMSHQQLSRQIKQISIQFKIHPINVNNIRTPSSYKKKLHPYPTPNSKKITSGGIPIKK